MSNRLKLKDIIVGKKVWFLNYDNYFERGKITDIEFDTSCFIDVVCINNTTRYAKNYPFFENEDDCKTYYGEKNKAESQMIKISEFEFGMLNPGDTFYENIYNKRLVFMKAITKDNKTTYAVRLGTGELFSFEDDRLVYLKEKKIVEFTKRG